MATARDMIKGAMRLIGAIASGETPSAAELSDGLLVLNEMLDSWSTENLIIHRRTREEFSLVGAQQSYTMGDGGDFDTSRPMEIESVLLKDESVSPAFETPLRLLTPQEYQAKQTKTTSSSQPMEVYVEPTHPLLTLWLWPIPTTAHKLVVNSMKALTQIANVSDTIDLPPGYLKLIRYGLACELGPEYGRELDPMIPAQFEEAKANVKRRNSRVEFMTSDAPVRGRRFNILTGD